SRDHPMHWWMNRPTPVVEATGQFHTAIVQRECSMSGESALVRHLLNARRRPSRAGVQIAKKNPESPDKIDAAVAAVLAWQARLAAVAAGLNASRGVPRRIR